MRKTRVVVLAVGFAAGCVDDVVLDDSEQAIKVGTDDISDPVRNAVVAVGDTCAGTLIAPNIVLTAASCVINPYFDWWPPTSLATGEWVTIAPVTIKFGPDVSAPIATRTSNTLTLPQGGRNNIALLRLATPVPATLAVPRPTYVDRPATLTSTSMLTQVGYAGRHRSEIRRHAPASGYRDWLSASRSINQLEYAFPYDGDGPFDEDDTNFDPGDLGGPVLLGGPTSHVLGVLIGLGEDHGAGTTTFGPGDDSRSSVRNWLQRHAPQRSDFDVIAISVAGCTGSGGNPTVRVTLQNRGVRTASVRVDVFHGLDDVPALGTRSTIFRQSPFVAPLQTIDMSFAIPAPPGGRWVDALLDTTRTTNELDETDNIGTAHLMLPDCSFN